MSGAGCLYFFFLMPGAPEDLKGPVGVYCAVIATMAARSYARAAVFPPGCVTLGRLGALLFMVSDAIIGLNKFVVPFGAAKTLVMVRFCVCVGGGW